MTKAEIDATRIKAMLSFDEEEELVKTPHSRDLWVYKNSRGEDVICVVLLRRSAEEIVVQTANGTRVCLTETQIHKL